MKKPNTKTHLAGVQVGGRSYWESKGVKFEVSKAIPFSLNGGLGEERDSWGAVYKNIFLACGGSALEPMIEWMDQRHDKIIAKMKSRDEALGMIGGK